MYTTSSAAGNPIPGTAAGGVLAAAAGGVTAAVPGGVNAAALPSPKPLDAAAPTSSAIVPHQFSLTEVIGDVETKAGLAGQSLPNG